MKIHLTNVLSSILHHEMNIWKVWSKYTFYILCKRTTKSMYGSKIHCISFASRPQNQRMVQKYILYPLRTDHKINVWFKNTFYTLCEQTTKSTYGSKIHCISFASRPQNQRMVQKYILYPLRTDHKINVWFKNTFYTLCEQTTKSTYGSKIHFISFASRRQNQRMVQKYILYPLQADHKINGLNFFF